MRILHNALPQLRCTSHRSTCVALVIEPTLSFPALSLQTTQVTSACTISCEPPKGARGLRPLGRSRKAPPWVRLRTPERGGHHTDVPSHHSRFHAPNVVKSPLSEFRKAFCFKMNAARCPVLGGLWCIPPRCVLFEAWKVAKQCFWSHSFNRLPKASLVFAVSELSKDRIRWTFACSSSWSGERSSHDITVFNSIVVSFSRRTSRRADVWVVI